MAGCLFQAVWNLRAGSAPAALIKDYDLFYFDATDLSETAEALVNARVQACFADLGVEIEAKNQARVHTWYESYFGYPYPALVNSCDGIRRFLVAGTCVALRPGPNGPELHAPYGLNDVYDGILRPNPLCNHRPLFLQKARHYQARWNWLQIDDTHHA